MATCSRCKKSGLTLKLDIRDLCPSCQAEKNYAIEQELKKLQSFYDQFKCIPNAKAEAEQIVSEAQKQAHLFHEEIVQEKEALQSENDRINNLQEFYDKWRIVPDADFEARTILAEAHNQAAVIIAEAEAYKQKTLMEIEQAHEKLNKKNEEVRLNTTAAIANAQAHIAALLASASRDFSSMAKERAAKELEYQPLKFQKLTPSVFGKAAKKSFVAFDLETTGLSPTKNEIIEIGAIKYVNMQKVAEFSTLVKPKKPIPSTATAINNITNAMVEDAPELETALSDFVSFIEDMPLVAHNADFDISFLERALIVAGISVDIKYGDSLAIARKKFKGLDSYRLGNVGEFLGSKTTSLHRALADCAIVGDIICTDESDVLSFTF